MPYLNYIHNIQEASVTNYSVKYVKSFHLRSETSVSNKPLIKTDLPFNIPISVLTELATEAPILVGRLQRLISM
jgi:hypothetical protein